MALAMPRLPPEPPKAPPEQRMLVHGVLRDLPLVGYRSTTFRNEAKERGAEPDECYRVGSLMKDGELPHIALVVIHTNPLLDKLSVCEGLGVPEIWLFKEGAFEVYRLTDAGYERIQRSEFLPELDLAMIAELGGREDQHQALQELRKSLEAQDRD